MIQCETYLKVADNTGAKEISSSAASDVYKRQVQTAPTSASTRTQPFSSRMTTALAAPVFLGRWRENSVTLVS